MSGIGPFQENAPDPTENTVEAKAWRESYASWYEKNKAKIKANMLAGKLDIYEGIDTEGFIIK